VNFDAQNHMFLDDNRKCVSPVMHCCHTSYNPVWPVIRTFPSTELTGTWHSILIRSVRTTGW